MKTKTGVIIACAVLVVPVGIFVNWRVHVYLTQKRYDACEAAGKMALESMSVADLDRATAICKAV